MDTVINKYKNCCRLCHDPISDFPLQISRLGDAEIIKSVIGKILEKTEGVLSPGLCLSCAGNLSNFIAFFKKCRNKCEEFEQELNKLGLQLEDSPQAELADTTVNQNQPEAVVIENQIPNDNIDPVEINERNNIITPEPTIEYSEAEDPNLEKFICDACGRIFLNSDEHLFKVHLRDAHIKKVTCPFGCKAIRKDSKKAEKRKLFKNLYYLANHIQNVHLKDFGKNVPVITQESQQLPVGI